MTQRHEGKAPRRPRRDAEANRERLLATAATVMTREGRHVPLAEIAAEAGVGVGTLYRNYPDRDALLHALEHRAYGMLIRILAEIADRHLSGLDAIHAFLARTLDIAGDMVLPLHGAPPLMTPDAVAARQEIRSHLDSFIARGHTDGSVRAAVNATDIIVFSALITQPLAHGPDWPRIAARQLALFRNGLATATTLPGPPVTGHDIEAAFATTETALATTDR